MRQGQVKRRDTPEWKQTVVVYLEGAVKEIRENTENLSSVIDMIQWLKQIVLDTPASVDRLDDIRFEVDNENTSKRRTR